MSEDQKNEQDNYGFSNSPIHIMKDDLEEIRNPKKEMSFSSPPAPASPPKIPSTPPVEKPKPNPFLAPTNPEITLNQAPKEPEKKFSPTFKDTSSQNIPAKEIPKKLASTGEKNSTSNKFVSVIIVFVLLLAVGLGGYYYWMTQYSFNETTPEEITTTEQQTQEVVEQVEQKEQEPEIVLATDKANSFSVDIANIDKASLENKINAYLEKAKELKITSPAELTLVDLSNNPVSFKAFSEKIGITLPTEATAALKDTFSLFIYNDAENYRLGLSIDSLSDVNLKTALSKEESNLTLDLNSILINPDKKEVLQKSYSSSTYKGATIRYNNIVSPEYLSVDYAIFQKKLIIGTTKNMSRAIIDYLSAKSATPEVSKNKPAPTGTDLTKNGTPPQGVPPVNPSVNTTAPPAQ